VIELALRTAGWQALFVREPGIRPLAPHPWAV